MIILGLSKYSFNELQTLLII